MPVAKTTIQVTQEICNAISSPLSDGERAEVSKIVETALFDIVARTVRGCKSAAVVCCGPEADLAHKIAEEMELKRTALVASLSSMR